MNVQRFVYDAATIDRRSVARIAKSTKLPVVIVRQLIAQERAEIRKKIEAVPVKAKEQAVEKFKVAKKRISARKKTLNETEAHDAAFAAIGQDFSGNTYAGVKA
ncbi:MAG: hypothetical protein JKY34_01255 [Kordiimonadaceae bacterium]|nr:hypothetical protein [Kordiimonadaceae bacterium]